MITHNAQETIQAGIDFAKKLHGREILALTGDLGSGKTTFMKGLAEGLHVNETITSPTFVLLKPYQGQINNRKIELVHIDAYRIDTIEDIKSVGIEDYLDRDDIVLAIEWAEKIKEILPVLPASGPKNMIQLNFRNIDENTREITNDFVD